MCQRVTSFWLRGQKHKTVWVPSFENAQWRASPVGRILSDEMLRKKVKQVLISNPDRAGLSAQQWSTRVDKCFYFLHISEGLHLKTNKQTHKQTCYMNARSAFMPLTQGNSIFIKHHYCENTRNYKNKQLRPETAKNQFWVCYTQEEVLKTHPDDQNKVGTTG